MGKRQLNMFKQFLAVLFVTGLAQASAQPKDLICDICLDVVTDLDEWLTSDATEGEIVHFMESLCTALGNILADLETMCFDLMEAQLPSIIDGLVEQNLNPAEVCCNISACSGKPTDPAPATTGTAPATTGTAPAPTTAPAAKFMKLM